MLMLMLNYTYLLFILVAFGYRLKYCWSWSHSAYTMCVLCGANTCTLRYYSMHAQRHTITIGVCVEFVRCEWNTHWTNTTIEFLFSFSTVLLACSPFIPYTSYSMFDVCCIYLFGEKKKKMKWNKSEKAKNKIIATTTTISSETAAAATAAG